VTPAGWLHTPPGAWKRVQRTTQMQASARSPCYSHTPTNPNRHLVVTRPHAASRRGIRTRHRPCPTMTTIHTNQQMTALLWAKLLQLCACTPHRSVVLRLPLICGPTIKPPIPSQHYNCVDQLVWCSATSSPATSGAAPMRQYGASKVVKIPEMLAPRAVLGGCAFSGCNPTPEEAYFR
jgi:hypothetical protein